MRIKFAVFMLAVCSFYLASCSSPSNLSGYVYAFFNNNLIVTNLSTGNVIANFKGSKTDYFRYATKIDDATILLSGVNHAWLYDRFKSKLIPYAMPKQYDSMIMPVYMSKYKSLLFYCSDHQLCSMSFNNPNAVSVLDTTSAQDGGLGGAGYNPIVAISDDEILYSTDNSAAKYYNLNTKKAGYLPIGKCIPQLWRSKTQQLLCLVIEPKAHYYLIKLDGSDKESAPDFNGMPAIYLPHFDTILAGGGQLKWRLPDPVPYEWSELRAYNLKNDKDNKVASGSWVYQGGAVWFSDAPTKFDK